MNSSTITFKDIHLVLENAFPKAKRLTNINIGTSTYFDSNNQSCNTLSITGKYTVKFEDIQDVVLHSFDINFLLCQSVHESIRSYIAFNTMAYDPNLGLNNTPSSCINMRTKTITANFSMCLSNEQLNQVTKNLLHEIVDKTLLS